MTALPGHDPVDAHLLPDSERILRAHGGWHKEWDERNLVIHREEPPEHEEQVRFAIECYASGKLPIQVRWALAEKFGRECRIGRVVRAAEKAVQEAAEAPAALKRAQVHAMRHKAIAGALEAGCYGPAMAGINRAGEVAGELSAEVGLSAEDLRLIVEVEGDLPPLPADMESDQTEALPDTNSDQGEG